MTQPEYSHPATTAIKTRGEIYEGIGFTFCKAATILLLIHTLQLGKFALPIVAGATAILYLCAFIAGQRSSRCILGKPLAITAFWGAISLFSLWFLLRPAGS